MLIRRGRHDRADAGGRRLACGETKESQHPLGHSRRTGPLFIGLVVGVILIMGGLTYFPALTLAPIARAVGSCWRGHFF